jgi:hypothetical protein
MPFRDGLARGQRVPFGALGERAEECVFRAEGLQGRADQIACCARNSGAMRLRLRDIGLAERCARCLQWT